MTQYLPPVMSVVKKKLYDSKNKKKSIIENRLITVNLKKLNETATSFIWDGSELQFLDAKNKPIGVMERKNLGVVSQWKMYEESLNNIAMVHASCGDARRDAWQADNKDTILKNGDYVKIGVEDDGKTEHMWFIIKNIDGNTITGKLDNDPIVVNMKCGDELKFDRSAVSQYLPGDSPIQETKINESKEPHIFPNKLTEAKEVADSPVPDFSITGEYEGKPEIISGIDLENCLLACASIANSVDDFIGKVAYGMTDQTNDLSPEDKNHLKQWYGEWKTINEKKTNEDAADGDYAFYVSLESRPKGDEESVQGIVKVSISPDEDSKWVTKLVKGDKTIFASEDGQEYDDYLTPNDIVELMAIEFDGASIVDATPEDLKEEAPTEDIDTAEITVGNYPYYLTKIDSTHFFMSNTKDVKGAPWHVGQFNRGGGNQLYRDLNNWVSGKLNINGKKYDNFDSGGEVNEEYTDTDNPLITMTKLKAGIYGKGTKEHSAMQHYRTTNQEGILTPQGCGKNVSYDIAKDEFTVTESKINEGYTTYKDDDGDIVYNIPYAAKTLPDLIEVAKDEEDLMDFLYSNLGSNEGVKTSDGNVYWGADVQDHLPKRKPRK